MKPALHTCFSLVLIFVINNSYGQVTPTAVKNYVQESTPRIPYTTFPSSYTPSDVQTSIQYFDGLGNPLRTVIAGGGPTGTVDIISDYTVYDIFYRPKETYLPFPSNSSSVGGFVTGINTFNTYQDGHAFSFTQYENSALNRPVKTRGPGDAWFSNNKTVDVNYSTATILKIEGNASSITASGTLQVQKNTSTDEEGQRVHEYIDNLGRTVRKEVELEPNVFATTAYVYDDYNRLTAVIQPRYFELNTGSFSINVNTEPFTESVFAYEYDARGRVLRKHVPGYVSVTGTFNTGWEEYVYDKNSRIVFSRNPRQAEQSRWTFMLYDVFGRETMKGERQLSGETRATLQTKMDAHSGLTEETRNSTGPIYYTTTQSIPNTIAALSTSDIQSVQYYDTYQNIDAGLTFLAKTGFPTNVITDVKGMPVGSKSLNNETNNWISQAAYVDNVGNTIQTRKKEVNASAYSAIEGHDVWMSYSFSHEVLKTDHAYSWKPNQSAALQTTNTSEEYEYDHMSRPLKYYHGVDGPVNLVAEYEYDAIGRLLTKEINDGSGGAGASYIIRTTAPTQSQQTDQAPDYVIYEAPVNGELIIAPDINSFVEGQIGAAQGGGGIIQTINYGYHIRGGIKSINGELFSMALDYEQNGGYYNGNIKKQSWTVDAISRDYTYTYDLSSRLKTANYSGGNTGIGENYGFNSPMTYDHNGNIKTLSRNGVTAGTIASPSGYNLIDNLTYTYNSTYSNKLLKVEDAITGTMTGRGDFINTNGFANDYSYYNDGSLKTDANKSITSITYNQYNLTKQVIVNGNTVDYVYDGNGTKLKKKTSSGTETIYEGGLILEKNGANLEIYQIGHAEGRYTVSLGYEYTYTDHLGNTRVMFNAQNGVGTITQNNAYDPWGLELKGIGLSSIAENHFKYNGKEEQLETAWMDYGARMYDAQLGRWFVVDPLADEMPSWSPYVFEFNNPLRFIDPDGRKPLDIILAYRDSKGNKRTYDYKRGSSYAGKNQFIRDFYHSMARLNNKGAGGIFKKLEEHKSKIYVEETNKEVGEFQQYRNTIKWNSRLGVKTTSGNLLTPTSVLNHEGDHALQYNEDKEKSLSDTRTYDRDYDNKEEKRVIEGSEQTTAKKIGLIGNNEVTRRNHQGTLYITTGVNSTTPKPSIEE